jgi:hypothetical protein
MEQHTFNRFPIIGFVLVLLGVALLLNQMSVIHIGGWALVWLGLLVYGAAVVLRSFISNDRSKVFFGTLCFPYRHSILFAEGGLHSRLVLNILSGVYHHRRYCLLHVVRFQREGLAPAHPVNYFSRPWRSTDVDPSRILVQQGRLEIDRILLAVDFDSYRGDDVIAEMEDEVNEQQYPRRTRRNTKV